MKVRLYSDLHNEFQPFNLPAPLYPDDTVLVLAGDIDVAPYIDKLLGFIGAASRKYKHVIYLPGNHEFYRGEWNYVMKVLDEQLKTLPNVVYLNNTSCMIEDVLFLGGTMWTDMWGYTDPSVIRPIKNGMNDYAVILKAGKALTPADTIEEFEKTKKFIFETLAGVDKLDPKPRKTVVVTHHGPTSLSIDPKFLGHPLNPAFVAMMDDEVKANGPDLWLHGHTHTPVDYVLGKTHVIANPRGYVFRSGGVENKNFNPALDIEV